MKDKEFGVFCPHCGEAIRIEICIMDYSLALNDVAKYKGIPKQEKSHK